MGLVSLRSNLAINGTPERYDTQGKLGDLPPGASQLDFDGALPAPVDFITNNNARGFTIGMNSTNFKKKGQTSRLGFAAPLPAPVDFFLNNNANGFTLNMNSSRFKNQGQTSQLGFPGPVPGAQDFFLNTHANGFTIRMNSTQFKNDGQTSQFGFTGALPPPVDFFLNTHANGFTLQAPTLITQFIDPGNSSQYGFPGSSQGAPEVDFFVNKNRLGFKKFQQVGVSYFINDGQTSIHGFPGALPSPVDYFTNDHASGFTLRAPVGVTQFAFDGQTSQYGFQGKLPPATDWFSNRFAKGFTIQNPVGVSQFVGIQANTYTNPSGKNLINTQPGPSSTDWFSNRFAKGFTIKNPFGVSQFIGIDTSGGRGGGIYTNPNPFNRIGKVTNWFPDETSGAKGFKDRLAPYESGYIGISADSTKYQYPNTVAGGRLLNVRLGQGAGTAKLENQLGNGSKMGNTGFYAENRYGEAVRNADNGSLLASWALRRRSPSPLEQQYSKFKLRNEAFNPTFIGHPLILRGLQNPDVLGPQRWGIDALGQQEGRTAANNIAAALDGGFIRGGASTAAERSAIDTARIAKFLASPRGIVWVTTQIGLGKSNPLVEKNPIFTLPFNDTRTHTGIASLLSIPGTAFGTHITRHGIPFANEVASYGRVMGDKLLSAGNSMTEIVLKNPGATGPQPSDRYNRLLQLKKELFGVGNGTPPKNSSLGFFQKLSTLFRAPVSVTPGSLGVRGGDTPIIQTLSGLGGPGSVYGIGSTTIRRYVDTVNFNDEESKRLISRAGHPGSLYNAFQKYYTGHLGNTVPGGDISLGIEGDRRSDLQILLKRKIDNAAIENIDYNPGTFNTAADDLGRTSYQAKPTDTDGTSRSGNKHSVLPYVEIRNIAERRRNGKTTDINDFRTNLTGDTKTFSTNPELANYAVNNLRDRYGFGDHGSTDPDIDRSNPYVLGDEGNIDGTIGILNDKTNTTKRFALVNQKNFRGDKITAIDYVPEADAITKTEIYPTNVRDFIKFYFSGVNLYDEQKDDVIVFRSTIKGLSDSFSPGWNTVSIMGRPDGPAIYSSFERNIGFQFTVAATSRAELVPMWRKLNYLASYTMPIYGSGRPGGALCRMTIGDMFNNTPGYFTGLSITVNDEASWDLADDLESDTFGNASKRNEYAKQLPNIVDVDVQFKIIHDWRPQKGGRVYSLYNGNFAALEDPGNWLWDSNI